MARFNRQSGKRPIVSNKEIVDSVNLLVPGGTNTAIDVATAVNDYTGTVGTVPLGAKILGFYLETSYHLVQNISGRFDWYICKRESGRVQGNFPTPGSTGGDELRKRIYHERKGILDGGPATNQGGQTAKSVEFVKIPRGVQRMGENDAWTLFAGASTNYSFCLKCIYKWYI